MNLASSVGSRSRRRTRRYSPAPAEEPFIQEAPPPSASPTESQLTPPDPFASNAICWYGPIASSGAANLPHDEATAPYLLDGPRGSVCPSQYAQSQRASSNAPSLRAASPVPYSPHISVRGSQYAPSYALSQPAASPVPSSPRINSAYGASQYAQSRAASPVPSSPPIHTMGWLAAAGESIQLERPLPSVRAQSPNELGLHALSEHALSPLPSRMHSELYYFDDGNVIFQVKDVLYRVHKYFFKTQSPDVFGKMFSDLSTTDPGKGSTDDHPICLNDVSLYEFDALLDFMYHAIFTGGPSSFETWTAILRVSDIWRFNSIKAQAIKRIDTLAGLATVDRIVLAGRAGVDEWLLPAYISLVERDEPISVHEARKLISLGERPVGPVMGLDILSLLAQARERHHRTPGRDPVSIIIEEVFGYP